ncbi:MAG: class I SAM-dependent methyltransferase [Candidatus Zapsychrus exili]|nr:class I SAM-dependent methyltransferase [Candidatus Zapsychrus exili]
MSKVKDAYKDYYKELKTAIGGTERFFWYSDILIGQIKNKVILDIGCGEGSFLKILKDRKNKVFGVDLSGTGLNACKEKGIECALIDISTEDLPYDDNTFDIVFLLATIEHLENPCHALFEIKRVLKENGLFIVSIPNPKSLHPYIYPGLFSVKSFKDFLGLTSFEILKVKGLGQAIMLNRFIRWLKKKDLPYLANLIYFIGRKRNLLMRKHLGTPLNCSFMYVFVCLNHKKSKTLVEEVAEETTPK